MGDSSGQYKKLPPGWDCKYDQATGNCYYINYFTKALQLEDPRMRYKPLQNEKCSTESIAMAPLNGSPYHVYPTNNFPAVRAFQAPNNNLSSQNMSTSPLLSSRSNLEMSPLPLSKASAPQTPHRMQTNTASMSRRSTIQETSFTTSIDTDAVVSKIQNIFPTAGENHIRLLLKRYYNSEAVVISALQVEKYPVTMPGPFVTPPSQRHLYHSNSAFYMTPPTRRLDMASTSRGRGLINGFAGVNSRTSSPVPAGGRFGSVMSMHSGIGLAKGTVAVAGAGVAGFNGNVSFHGSPRFGDQIRSSPKPHSSPKMKLRYMKTIFPKADETLLLDILANADNNVQTASEKLISMGYDKRDVVPPKNTRAEFDAEGRPKKPNEVQFIPLRPKEYTDEEKEQMKIRLKEKYNKIAERIILMALESVSYAEDRAMQILQIVQDEEDATRDCKGNETSQKDAHHATETLTDGIAVSSAGCPDNLITIVLETTNAKQTNKTKVAARAGKRLLPSINVTTPSTTTTQIILSHSPNEEPNESINSLNEKLEHTKHCTEQKVTSNSLLSSTSKLSSLLSSKSLSSPSASVTVSQSFQSISTKDILARSINNETGIKEYLKKPGVCTAASESILDKLKLSRSRDKSYSLKYSGRDSIEEDSSLIQHQEFKSLLGRLATVGRNAELAKGPDDSILLADYVTWNGANPTISVGHKQIATGADAALLSERNYVAVGRNPDLCKGPIASLAKGSIYAQLAAGSTKSSNIKCN